MIKEIKIPYGSGFTYDGGTLVVGDTKAYFITVTLPTAADDTYTALAVNQINGNYSDDSTVSSDGHTVSVRLINSMYNTEGLAIIRLVIMDGDKTVTVKEVRFEVLPENNMETVANDEPNILNTLTDIKSRLNKLGLKIITSIDDYSACSPGVYLVEKDNAQNILIVSVEHDEALMTDAIVQFYVNSINNTIKKRSGHVMSGNPSWNEWENVGESDLSEYYTKSEIDSKIASVYKYKGSKRTFSELPPSAACVAGDVWNVESEVSRNFYGVKVVSVYAYGMGFDGEGGEMALTDVSAFTVGKTYQVCTEGKKILGTMTPTGISGNTLSFTHQTNSDYYGVFCDIAETKDSDYWNTWMAGTAVAVNETYYFYNADFASTPPGTDKITKIINEGGTNFAWTGTAWDALGGTVDFSDYYTRAQVDGKIAAAIESALNTEV